MSFIHTLKKLVDPNAARREEQRRKAEREAAEAQESGDPPRFTCRVCGLTGEEEGYCPTCLAPTMEPAREE
ncbi:MAG: hypothetical protein P1V51_12450 [Deltaproteobacteria bacterium]|nr:hypothetical protein [Deltaproteobacteria bacterium]